MKKKLEADLISIAHRILKLKNRAELDQLLEETQKLYEKLTVLRFVEDHFGGSEPTIGRASAVFELEEIYDLKEVEHVKGNEQEALEEEARAKKAEEKKAEKENSEEEKAGEDKENESGEGVDTDGDGKAPVSAEEESEVADEAEPETKEDSEEEAPSETEEAPKQDKENENGEGVATEPEEEEAPVSEEEKELTEESDEELSADDASPKGDKEDAPSEKEEEVKEEPATEAPAVEEPKEEPKQEEPKAEEPTEEPEVKVEVTKPAETIKAEEKSAAAVFDKEHESTLEEWEKATDAEIKTIEPDAAANTANAQKGFDFGYGRAAEAGEPAKQKEISFEDFRDYKEPEFVKKDALDTNLATPIPPEVKEEILEENDWRNWEPKKAEEEKPKFDWEASLETPKKEEPTDWKSWEPAKDATPEPAQPKQGFAWDEPKKELVREEEKPAAPKAGGDGYGKTINLALNDRIAFEKHLFAGSGDDLNRVISQLNTLNSYREAQNFIEDLVKPDYNNWNGKDEFADRFMAIVEKRFS
jgi:hypothetical protein